MNSFIRVGKRGEISLPEGVRQETRIEEGTLLYVQTEPDGSITLRRVREYTDEDIEMFATEDEMTPVESERFLKWLGREPRLFGR